MKTYIYQTFDNAGINCYCEDSFINGLTRPSRRWQVIPCIMDNTGKIVPNSTSVLCESDDPEVILRTIQSGGYYRLTEVKEISELDKMFGFTPLSFDVICFELQ